MALVLKASFGHDLDELRADLEAVEIGLGRLVNKVGKRKLAPLVAEVQALMPFDAEHRGWPAGDRGEPDPEDPGHIRESVKGGIGTTSNRFGIFTTHPGGPVHWWGGTIRPKGHTITIHPEPGAGEEFVSKTADEVVAAVDDEFDQLLRRNRL